MTLTIHLFPISCPKPLTNQPKQSNHRILTPITRRVQSEWRNPLSPTHLFHLPVAFLCSFLVLESVSCFVNGELRVSVYWREGNILVLSPAPLLNTRLQFTPQKKRTTKGSSEPIESGKQSQTNEHSETFHNSPTRRRQKPEISIENKICAQRFNSPENSDAIARRPHATFNEFTEPPTIPRQSTHRKMLKPSPENCPFFNSHVVEAQNVPSVDHLGDDPTSSLALSRSLLSCDS